MGAGILVLFAATFPVLLQDIHLVSKYKDLKKWHLSLVLYS